jgi:hypothetical protein
MRCKHFVTQQLEVAHHFIERCAGGRARRFKAPATLGATKTPKTVLLNPYQFPPHGRLYRCAPTSRCLLSGNETSWLAINVSFRSGALLDCGRKPSPTLGVAKMRKRRGSLHAPIWMVCRAPYIHGKVLRFRTPEFRGLV